MFCLHIDVLHQSVVTIIACIGIHNAGQSLKVGLRLNLIRILFTIHATRTSGKQVEVNDVELSSRGTLIVVDTSYGNCSLANGIIRAFCEVVGT